jgi:hypothetical protein
MLRTTYSEKRQQCYAMHVKLPSIVIVRLQRCRLLWVGVSLSDAIVNLNFVLTKFNSVGVSRALVVSIEGVELQR